MLLKKHYIITAITLGAIAASSGLLIGATNLITSNRIKENEANKVIEGINSIFEGKTVQIKEEMTIEQAKEESKVDSDFKYVTYLYSVVDENQNELGMAIKTSGSNMYGKIALIVGFDRTYQDFIKLSVITNEQTYASTLEENYINPLNEHDINQNDVNCGATYGAKLIRDMIKEGQKAAEEFYN